MARKHNTTASAENQVTVESSPIFDEAAEMAALEAALNGEDVTITEDPAPALPSLEVTELSEVPDAELVEEDHEAAVEAEIAAEEAKTDAYKNSDAEDADDAEADEGKVTKGKRASTPRTKLPFDETIKAMFAAEPAILDTEEGELDDEQLQATLIDKVTQKKVKEKVVNVLQSVTNGTDPSIYTKIALDLLVKAYLNDCATVSLTDIKKAYEAKGYKAGTISAQSGQMMALMPVLRIASKTQPGQLKPNANSVILDALASS